MTSSVAATPPVGSVTSNGFSASDRNRSTWTAFTRQPLIACRTTARYGSGPQTNASAAVYGRASAAIPAAVGPPYSESSQWITSSRSASAASLRSSRRR